MKLSLQKDWTLAHFLSYSAAITVVLLAMQLLIQVIMFNQVGMDFPMKFTVEDSNQLGTVMKSGYMLLPDNQQAGVLVIKEVENRSRFYSIFLVALKVIEPILFIFCAYLVWRIFQSVAKGEPFSESNYKKMFLLGWIFILVEFLAFGRAYYVEWLTYDAFVAESIRLIGETSEVSHFIFIGIVIIAIGSVFKEGNRIYEEQKLEV